MRVHVAGHAGRQARTDTRTYGRTDAHACLHPPKYRVDSSTLPNESADIALITNFSIQMVRMVEEKENHLRSAMAQMGMLDSAYFLSWHVTHTLINLVVTFLVYLAGFIIQEDVRCLLCALWCSLSLLFPCDSYIRHASVDPSLSVSAAFHQEQLCILFLEHVFVRSGRLKSAGKDGERGGARARGLESERERNREGKKERKRKKEQSKI